MATTMPYKAQRCLTMSSQIKRKRRLTDPSRILPDMKKLPLWNSSSHLSFQYLSFQASIFFLSQFTVSPLHIGANRLSGISDSKGLTAFFREVAHV